MLEIQKDVVKVTGTPSMDDNWKADNLITNLNSRSSGNGLFPVVASKAYPLFSTPSTTHRACYKTLKTQVDADGGVFKLTLDLGESLF